MKNIILNTDSYKASHHLQHPPEVKFISSYIEARHGYPDEVLFFGLQAFLKEYLAKPITIQDIDEAEEVLLAHGEPFNREGWMEILRDYDGYLPIEIRALPEGSIVPLGVPLVQVQNTDGRFPWLTSYIETALLRGVWYPTTVASVSYKARKIIQKYLDETSTETSPEFKLHDFGARGVSSEESAAIGGMAHLINFSGTDTLSGVFAARRYYNCKMAGYSIPAAEHSTITSWGRDNEALAYRNMIEQFKEGLFAVVSDSYDLSHAVDNIWGKDLREEVESLGTGSLVIRPDSGDPSVIVPNVLHSLASSFGYEVNSKGYRVLNPCVRVIQGDGVTLESLPVILEAIKKAGFAAENVAFGMGGGLLQKVNRDTMGFAMKASAVSNGHPNYQWTDVYKNPVTDPLKASKRGVQAVIKDSSGEIKATRRDQLEGRCDLLRVVFLGGRVLVDDSLDNIRCRAYGFYDRK